MRRSVSVQTVKGVTVTCIRETQFHTKAQRSEPKAQRRNLVPLCETVFSYRTSYSRTAADRRPPGRRLSRQSPPNESAGLYPSPSTPQSPPSPFRRAWSTRFPSRPQLLKTVAPVRVHSDQ